MGYSPSIFDKPSLYLLDARTGFMKNELVTIPDKLFQLPGLKPFPAVPVNRFFPGIAETLRNIESVWNPIVSILKFLIINF